MPQQLNSSEEFAFWVCRNSFLSLWSYPSPRGKDGKELCDILIVCDPDVVIVSVKEIQLQGNDSASVSRWEKRAIADSAKQIYGAERWLKNAEKVVRLDGSDGLPLPNPNSRRVHRVAIAFGGNGTVPIKMGNHGKGYVHVMDERSFEVILKELDTISDFTAYLLEKQRFSAKTSMIFESEEDVLALYLKHNRKFPDGHEVAFFDGRIWEALNESPEFQRRRLANQQSYIWDLMIESVSKDLLADALAISPGLANAELALRVMARENRFERRLLGKAFLEFVETPRTLSRLVQPNSGVSYVFLKINPDKEIASQHRELECRCVVARGIAQRPLPVVGIGVLPVGAESQSLSICYFHHPNWSEEDTVRAKEFQEQLGYFPSSRIRQMYEDEYPFARRSSEG